MQRRYALRPSLPYALLLIVGALAAQLVLAFLVGLLSESARLTLAAQQHWIIVLSELLFFGLPTILYYQRHASLESCLRIKPLAAPSGIMIGAASILGMLALSLLTSIWIACLEAWGFPVTGSGVAIPQTVPELCIGLLTIAVAPAVCEELLFRGMVLPAAEYPIGSRRAIVLSGLLFALMHGSVEGFPTHFLLGLLLGYLTVHTGSIWAPMIYHLGHNATSLLFTFWVDRNLPIPAPEATVPQVAETLQILPMLTILALLTGVLLRYAIRRQREQHRDAVILPRSGKLPVLVRIAICLLIAVLLMVYATNIYAAQSM